jgi:hypothetical protein
MKGKNLLVVVFIFILNFLISIYNVLKLSQPSGGCINGICVDYFGLTSISEYVYAFIDPFLKLSILEVTILLPIYSIYWYIRIKKNGHLIDIFKTFNMRLMLVSLVCSLFLLWGANYISNFL